MSRQLPPNPNFDYLKKQAKELLAELLPEQPGLNLAGAQRLLARDYGFASWAALKVHVLDAPGRALAGTWRVNLAKSQQSPANLFRDATLQFTVAGGSVTIADVVMDENGRTSRNTNTLVVDGVAHGQQYGYSVMSRWMTPRHLRAAMTKDGEARGHVDYVVAADGRTMTLATADSLILFERSYRDPTTGNPNERPTSSARLADPPHTGWAATSTHRVRA